MNKYLNDPRYTLFICRRLCQKNDTASFLFHESKEAEWQTNLGRTYNRYVVHGQMTSVSPPQRFILPPYRATHHANIDIWVLHKQNLEVCCTADSSFRGKCVVTQKYRLNILLLWKNVLPLQSTNVCIYSNKSIALWKLNVICIYKSS